jgi:hypothetical protein
MSNDIIQFQVHNKAIYVLTKDGQILYNDLSSVNTKEWLPLYDNEAESLPPAQRPTLGGLPPDEEIQLD